MIVNEIVEITKFSDPMLRIRLPKALHQAISETAKTNKRRPQDELIKRIAVTLKTDQLQEIQAKILAQLRAIYQSA